MATVAVSKLREHMVDYLKLVQAGETITITSRGREVAKLVPPENKLNQARKALQALRKTAVVGDVESPLDEAWKVLE
jgi:prevent-host-death family protein